MSYSSVSAELERAAQVVRVRLPAQAKPKLGLILGSGLGSFADQLADRVSIGFDQIPGLPRSTVVGHAGKLVYGRSGSATATGTSPPVELLALQGRIHYYEGHDLATVAFPARLLIALGCRTLIITNAAGGVDATFKPGEIIILRDHLNLMGGSPLRGPNEDALGPRFPDMTQVYAVELRQIAAEAGREVGLALREGIYAAGAGPNYETPAEVRMLRTLGADLVGMSTVPEVIAAAHMGARVLGLSCVTNLAAGITGERLSHEEVTETAARVRTQFEKLLAQIIAKLAAQKGDL